MELYLTSVDGENEDYETEITTCVLTNNSINILFQTIDDGDKIQGRLSLKPINGIQSTTGYWIYPDTKKETARFSETQHKSEESRLKAKITGSLKNYRGKKVVFHGSWVDVDGEYEIEIDAKIA